MKIYFRKLQLASVAPIALLYFSCGESQENSSSDTSTSKTEVQQGIPDFTKSLEGSIGGKYGIIMTLIKSGTDLSGTYSYKSQGVSIKLSGTIDQSGNITLDGFDEKGNKCDVFKGQLVQNSITGNWSKPDGSKSLPFSVAESANTEANLQQEVNESKEVDYSLSGTYYSGSNKLTIIEPAAGGDIQFKIEGKVDQYCAQNEIEGTATYRFVSAMQEVRNGAVWYEFSIGDCAIEIAQNEDGSVTVDEENCSGQKCGRNYPWAGKYTKK